jgi:hypothetical protein
MANFPTLQHNCKLCLLLTEDAEVWLEAHRRVYVDGIPRGAVLDWLNGRIAVVNLKRPEDDKLTPIHRTTMANHFTTHVLGMEEATMAKTAADQGFLVGGMRPALKYVRDVLGEGSAASDVDDYLRMQELVLAVERRLKEFDDHLKVKENKSGKGSLDLKDIAAFQKLVGNLMSLKRDVAKTQSSAKIAGMAVREAVEMVVDAMLSRIDSVVGEVRETLEQSMPGTSLPHQVSQLVRTQIGDSLRIVVPEVVTAVEKRYRIK